MLRWLRLLGVWGTLKPLLEPYCTLCTLSRRLLEKAWADVSVLAE
jgi:hypothetical protein